MKLQKLRLALPIILASGLPLYFGALQIAGNFHTAVAGKLYRSAQPSAADLAGYVRAYGIKTVINLRGAHPGEPWYDEEMRAARELRLYHIDIALSARREPGPARLLALEKALREAPAPILVHCKGGADRSGLAAALYVLEVEHGSPEAAAGQLSLAYGHFPYLWSRTGAMDRAFERAARLYAKGRPK